MGGKVYIGNLGPAWSAEEDDLLRARYVSDGAAACAGALAGRTRGAVMHRAQRLGLMTHRRWTMADDARLRQQWGIGLSVEAVAKRIGRTPKATYQRAKVIGLPLGLQPGYERWTEAAKRTGYCTTQLWRICRWAGVEVHRAMSRPSKPRGRRKAHASRHHFVDSFELDEAIERWHRTEAVHSAARARGLVGDTLRRWLHDAGLTPPDSKRHWRVDTEVIDRVVTHRLSVFHKKKRAAGQLELSA